jgi:hypothetical protein
MVINNETIEAIRKIIAKNYNRLAIAVLGRNNVPEEVREQFPDLDSNPLLAMVYYHNYLNEQGSADAPTDYSEMQAQQQPDNLPQGEAHRQSVDFVNSNIYQLIEKQKAEVESRVVGLVRDNNNQYKADALQNLDRTEYGDSVAKERTVPELKKRIENYLETDAKRDWNRITNTEVSNALGQGSVDRVVSQNKDKNLFEVFVYRVNPDDGRTCKYCRKFYIDNDSSPKVYRLSTLLSNGTNYGKKAVDWRPVPTSTHPNCRDSQIVELRPGWAVKPGGKVTYIGMEKWPEYIRSKVTA